MDLLAALTQEQFDGLDESQREFYGDAGDGVYVASVKPVTLTVGQESRNYALENVTGLKSSLSKQSKATRDLEKQLKAFEGIDAEAAREAMEKLTELENAPGDEKVNKKVEALKAQLEATYKRETSKLGQENAGLQEQLSRYRQQAQNQKLEGLMRDAVEAESGIKGAAFRALLPVLRDQSRFVEHEDSLSLEIIDREGTVRLSPKAGSMDPMSVREWVAEQKDGDFPFLFEGTNAKGAGVQTPGGRLGAEQLAKLPPTERLKEARRRGRT